MSLNFRSALLLTASVGAMLTAGLPPAQAATPTVNGGGSTLASPVYLQIFQSDLTSPTYKYYPSGSGAAQTAFLNNTISSFGAAGVTTGAVDFGASDATLSSAQISGFSTTNSFPLIQVPAFVTPITLAFNLKGQVPALTTDGAVTLTDATVAGGASQVCGVLSGKITDWHSINSAIPTGTTIKVVYRSDSSGTTFLLTQHLAAVCTAANSSFTTIAATKTFASLFATVPANFIAATGSGGVEAAVTGTANALGYLSPDFTDISPNNLQNAPGVYPPVAKVATTNANVTTAYLPNAAATSAAIGTAVYPFGGKVPPTGTNAANPANWIPTAANPSTGYPIVGYTTLEVSTCYADTTTVGAGVIKFLDSLYNAGNLYSIEAGEVIKGGFTLTAGASRTAAPTAGSLAADVVSTFLTGTGSLAIDNAAACHGKTGR